MSRTYGAFKPSNPLSFFHALKPCRIFVAAMFLTFAGCNDKPEVLPQDNRLRVYPNPVRDFVNISFSNPTRSAYIVVVFDPRGEIVLEKEESLTDPHYQLGVYEKAEGTYHVVVKKDNTTITRQFVKTKE